jgi:YHS domain-containing protein
LTYINIIKIRAGNILPALVYTKKEVNKMTRHNIVYDLKLSPYKIVLNDTTFYFSSVYHMQKFKEQFIKNRFIINDSLSNRFNIFIEVNEFADILLYRKIESRGFYIMNGSERICQPEKIILNGMIKTKQN